MNHKVFLRVFLFISILNALSITGYAQHYFSDPTSLNPAEWEVVATTPPCHDFVAASSTLPPMGLYWDGETNSLQQTGPLRLSLTLIHVNSVPFQNLTYYEDQYGGLWVAEIHKKGISHTFNPVHEGYLVAMKVPNFCKASRPGTTAVSKKNLKQAMRLAIATEESGDEYFLTQSKNELYRPIYSFQPNEIKKSHDNAGKLREKIKNLLEKESKSLKN